VSYNNFLGLKYLNYFIKILDPGQVKSKDPPSAVLPLIRDWLKVRIWIQVKCKDPDRDPG
jgi:hypothetical protein